jgi:hypothetical protein
LADSGEVLVEQSEEVHLPLAVSRIGRKQLVDVDDSLAAALVAGTVSNVSVHDQVPHVLVVRHECLFCMRTSKGPRIVLLLPGLRHDEVFMITV